MLHACKPRLVAPIDDLNYWRDVVDLLASQANTKLACDVQIASRCKRPETDRVIHMKSGQYLCLHRACNRCTAWLLYNQGSANQQRLEQLREYV